MMTVSSEDTTSGASTSAMSSKCRVVSASSTAMAQIASTAAVRKASIFASGVTAPALSEACSLPMVKGPLAATKRPTL